MKTMYYQTSHFIRHSGNVVDLGEYRRQLALAQEDSLARQPEAVYMAEEPEEPGFQPVVLTMSKAERRGARRERRGWMLDICASLAVVAMTLAFALRVLL